jgi:CRISPR-associated protein Cmr2
MPSLFIYSIGPVQDFIATAKRCRDLWFGSWLLSELAKAAARAVATFPGVAPDALIFPHGDLADLEPGSPMSVANKIVAQLPEGVDPAAVGSRCDEQISHRLHALRDRAFDRIRGPAVTVPSTAS